MPPLRSCSRFCCRGGLYGRPCRAALGGRFAEIAAAISGGMKACRPTGAADHCGAPRRGAHCASVPRKRPGTGGRQIAAPTNTSIMIPRKAGGISVSGIALILQATHKCVLSWPASHALGYLLPVNGSRGSYMLN